MFENGVAQGANILTTITKGKYKKINVSKFILYPNDTTLGRNAILLAKITPLSK